MSAAGVIVKTTLLILSTLFVSNFFILKNTPLYSANFQGTLIEKTIAYEENAQKFDTIFLGDSRTYCGIDPLIIDEKLGTRSVNISQWAHWLPTQLPQFRELIKSIPQHTTVVWSIGDQNFLRINEKLGLSYPIGLKHLDDYIFDYGYSWEEISENLLHYSTLYGELGLVPGLPLWVKRNGLKTKLNSFFEQGNFSNETTEKASDSQRFNSALSSSVELREKIALELSRDEQTKLQPIFEGKLLTSVAFRGSRGNYRRLELTPDFFREKQRTHHSKIKGDRENYQVIPEYWATFQAILEAFKSARVKLIVNKLEEAPYQYRGTNLRELSDEVMAKASEEVQKQGFPFLSVDFSKLEDHHYFDYNHLNTRGIELYNEMLSEKLRAENVGRK